MKNDILFVTAFRDINRGNWSHIPRGIESYCEAFYKYSSQMKYKIIVFISDKIKNYLLNKHTFGNNVIFLNNDCIDTFYHKYLSLETEIIKSDNFQKLISNDKKKAIPFLYPGYNLVNHSKINYVNEAKKRYKDYKFYSWIDFGIRLWDNSKLYNKTINIDTLPKKIIYQHIEGNIPISRRGILPVKEEKTTPRAILASHIVHFAGSIFIIHNELVEVYEKLYENKLKEFYDLKIVDDDQKLLLQVFLDNPDLFYMPNAINYPQLNIKIGAAGYETEWFKLLEMV